MHLKSLIGLLLIVAAAVLYASYERDYDPRAACDDKPSEAERAQCRTMVDFAMSAGW